MRHKIKIITLVFGGTVLTVRQPCLKWWPVIAVKPVIFSARFCADRQDFYTVSWLAINVLLAQLSLVKQYFSYSVVLMCK